MQGMGEVGGGGGGEGRSLLLMSSLNHIYDDLLSIWYLLTSVSK